MSETGNLPAKGETLAFPRRSKPPVLDAWPSLESFRGLNLLLTSKFRTLLADAFAASLSMQRSAAPMTRNSEFEAKAAAGLFQMQWVGR